jgi:hypothetical protein
MSTMGQSIDQHKGWMIVAMHLREALAHLDAMMLPGLALRVSAVLDVVDAEIARSRGDKTDIATARGLDGTEPPGPGNPLAISWGIVVDATPYMQPLQQVDRDRNSE